MEVNGVNILRGPNYWSVEEPNLIVLKVKTSPIGSDQLKQVLDAATKLFPSLSEKHSLDTDPKVDDLQLVKLMAMELQELAGMECAFGLTKVCANGESCIVFSYKVEQAGTYAARTAVSIFNALLEGKSYPLDTELTLLKRIKQNYGEGPTTAYILAEARKRNIPIRRMAASSLFTLGYGNRQEKLRTSVTDTTSGIGLELAANKEETKNILQQANIPVPKGIVVYKEQELLERLPEVKFPLVIKPLDGNHGRGITTKVQNVEVAKAAFVAAQKISNAVVVEEFIEGEDHRFLVIDYKLVAVARREPAQVKGDGVSTIRQLVEAINKDPQRGESYEQVLVPIRMDEITEQILSSKLLRLDSVLKAGEVLMLKHTSNISSGGTAIDLTDVVHPENKFMAERIARLFQLDICGVDIMTTSVEVPVTRANGAVIEVNAGPGIRMHASPQSGKARNVAAAIIDMLFPSGRYAIPFVTVTGDQHVQDIVNYIAGMADFMHYKAGYTTEEGVKICGHTVKGAADDFKKVQDVLFEPMIDFAVVACSVSGILRSGLPFANCDISIVDGISEDLSAPEIRSLEEMAKVQSLIPMATKKDGFAILNADDELVYKMYPLLECRVALYSTENDSEKIEYHRKRGRMAAVTHRDSIMVYNGDWSTRIKVSDLVLLNSEKGRLLLPVVLAGILLNFSPDQIRKALLRIFQKPGE